MEVLVQVPLKTFLQPGGQSLLSFKEPAFIQGSFLNLLLCHSLENST